MNKLIFLNNQSLSESIINEIQSLKDKSNILIPSGSTPRDIYEKLAKTNLAENHTFFALDEWVNIPSELDGSCLSMIHKDFIDRCNHSVHLVHFDPFNTIEKNIALYDKALNGREFDLVILGVGMNGHIGLNEPGSSIHADYLQTKLDEITIKVASNKYFSSDVNLSEGITVGINKILKSKKIIIIINDLKKQKIYQDILNGNSKDTSVPAIYIKQFPQVYFYITQDMEG